MVLELKFVLGFTLHNILMTLFDFLWISEIKKKSDDMIIAIWEIIIFIFPCF